MPNILLTRIDNRLVHGQVGVTWTKTIGANLLLVANDETSQDKIQHQLISVTAKSSVKCSPSPYPPCGTFLFSIG